MTHGPRWSRIATLVAGAALLAGSIATPSLVADRGASDPTPPAADLARGRALYERHCSVCHGPEGRGDGPAAFVLDPAPRNFAEGRFRLVSTQNGVPTQGDLIASIRGGMPGSAMPPWEWLAEEDLWNVAAWVHQLSVDGQVADLLRWAEAEGEDLSEPDARALVEDRVRPGEPIDTGTPAPHDAVTLQIGRRAYVRNCALCHGPDGTGNAPVNLSGELLNEDGTPNRARDFTAGIFKGGSSHPDIVRRIVAGLPGSPMPGTAFEDPAELAALASYVQSLVKPGAQERVSQRRRTVPVGRVDAELPLDPADARWRDVEGVWIALMPLWWRDERVEGLVVRALHDGNTIALRLSWHDPSNDDDLLSASSFSDSAAIEISVERDPPLFAMGATDHPVDIALWRAAWEADAVAARDVRDRWPDMPEDVFRALLGDLAEQSITARAAKNPQSVASRPTRAEALTAQGLGTVGPRGAGPSSWSARGAWADGYRDVVFTRAMVSAVEGEPALSPGLAAFVAFAVWDGSMGDRNGQKVVSVWHRLEVAP